MIENKEADMDYEEMVAYHREMTEHRENCEGSIEMIDPEYANLPRVIWECEKCMGFAEDWGIIHEIYSIEMMRVARGEMRLEETYSKDFGIARVGRLMEKRDDLMVSISDVRESMERELREVEDQLESMSELNARERFTKRIKSEENDSSEK